jgi:MSHA biogenesis protein MshK
MKDGRSALLVVLAGAIGSASASAQITTDPTRPPAAVAAEAPKGAVGGNQLQSVMISPTRKSAIINGVPVELGGKYGDAVLTKVAEDEVVLESGSSRQVLKLHPGVDKKIEVAQAEPIAPAAKSDSPEPKPKAKTKTKAKAKAKAKAKPDAGTQDGAKPAADSGAGSR